MQELLKRLGISIRNNKGFTLVEIVCAVAILSVVSGIVGGVMVSTAKSYNRGTRETAIQQEAQLAVNRIGDVIKDAVSVEFDGGALKIESGDNSFTVQHNASNNTLEYAEHTPSGDESGILAENITGFEVDTSNFEESRTVKVSLKVKDGEKEYAMSYNMSARNEMVTDESDITAPVRTASIITESKVIMVPGESDLPINVTVKGCSKDIIAEPGDGMSAVVESSGTESATLKLSLDAGFTGEKTVVNLKSDTEGGDPPVAVQLTIQVRRVKSIDVGYHLDSGKKTEAGAVYTFTGKVTDSTPYLSKVPVVTWDADYKNPYAMEWSYELLRNGAASANPDEIDDYIEIAPDVDSNPNNTNPYTTITLKKSLETDVAICVTAKSKHADGINKGNSQYGVVEASAELKGPTGKADKTVIAEPLESVAISGVRVAAPQFETIIDGAKAENDNVFESIGINNNNLEFKLKKDVTGGTNGEITLLVKSGGNQFLKLTIMVRRVNDIKMDYKQITEPVDKHPVQTPYKAGSDYQFKTTLDGTNLDRESKETDAEFKNPYAVRFEWYMKNASGDIINSTKGSAEWDRYDVYDATDNTIKSGAHAGKKYSDVYKNNYFHVVDIGNNKHNPCINFSLEKDFPKGYTLCVKATALHPSGNNRSNSAYGEVIGIAEMHGPSDIDMSIGEDYIIAEPNQNGVDDYTSKDSQYIPLVIPLTITKASASKVEVELPEKAQGLLQENTACVELAEKSDESKSNSGREIWLMKFRIARSEWGANDSGKIKVKVTAYDSDGNVFGILNTYIYIRRVAEVEIAEKDGKDNEITLEATPKGIDIKDEYGNHIDALEQQKAATWDNDDKYRSPYKFKWSYLLKSGDKAISTDKYNEYFKVLSENEKTVKLQLTNKLKNDPKIKLIVRATSLHSMGIDNETYYNKSGIIYYGEDGKDEAVYGEYVVSGNGDGSIPSPFTRGEEFFFQGESVTDLIALSNMINDKKRVSSEARFYFRFKDSMTGEWSPYYTTREQGNPQKLNAIETTIYLPDREYDIEFIKIVCDPGRKLLYWPKDGSVIAPGTGFEEYTLDTYQCDDSWIENNYPKVYHLGRAIPQFDGKSNLGSLSNPINLGSGGYYGATINVLNLNMKDSDFKIKEGVFPMTVQQYINGQWVTIDMDLKDQNNPYKWYIPQDDNCCFHIRANGSTTVPGKYRIGVGIKSQKFNSISGSLKNVSFTPINSPSAFPLYDEAADTGFIYLQIN